MCMLLLAWFRVVFVRSGDSKSALKTWIDASAADPDDADIKDALTQARMLVSSNGEVDVDVQSNSQDQGNGPRRLGSHSMPNNTAIHVHEGSMSSQEFYEYVRTNTPVLFKGMLKHQVPARRTVYTLLFTTRHSLKCVIGRSVRDLARRWLSSQELRPGCSIDQQKLHDVHLRHLLFIYLYLGGRGKRLANCNTSSYANSNNELKYILDPHDRGGQEEAGVGLCKEDAQLEGRQIRGMLWDQATLYTHALL
jgi:hypothetical protein